MIVREVPAKACGPKKKRSVYTEKEEKEVGDTVPMWCLSV